MERIRGLLDDKSLIDKFYEEVAAFSQNANAHETLFPYKKIIAESIDHCLPNLLWDAYEHAKRIGPWTQQVVYGLEYALAIKRAALEKNSNWASRAAITAKKYSLDSGRVEQAQKLAVELTIEDAHKNKDSGIADWALRLAKSYNLGEEYKKRAIDAFNELEASAIDSKVQ